jgi:D-amino peptidase
MEVPTMRLYVSSDIEGVAGVVSALQTTPEGGAAYERARRLMTAEVQAAIHAAYGAGASHVLVNDGHGPNTNLLIEDLDERVTLLTGRPKPLNMMEGIDGGFDAAILLGYHARSGTRAAILDHAYLGAVGYDLHLAGRSVGEFAMNAMLAGHHGVPVVMVSGDEALVAEANSLLPAIEAVAVKRAVSRTAAASITPAAARSRIADAVRRALARDVRACLLTPPPPPIVLDVTFLRTAQADVAELLPGSERTEGRTVRFTAGSYPDVFRACRALLLLGSTAA